MQVIGPPMRVIETPPMLDSGVRRNDGARGNDGLATLAWIALVGDRSLCARGS